MRRRTFLTSLAGSVGLALASGARSAPGAEALHHAPGAPLRHDASASGMSQ
ncbi:MAG: hypothetical protein WBF69_01130 [Castellaniella sp.]|uniref:hypothetical protein n=1 Tax=Castellaniella sp. TaxID=1955812 RepID=UPI003C771454